MRNCMHRRFPAKHLSHLCVLFCLITVLIAPGAYAAGRRWISNGPEMGIIKSLAIDPQTPETIYTGTGGRGVFKSTDGGGIWTAVNSGLTSTYVYALAVNSLMPDTI